MNDSRSAPDLKVADFQWLVAGGGRTPDNWARGSAVTSVAGAISLGVSTMNASGGGEVIYTSSTGWNSGNDSDREPVNCRARVWLENDSAKTVKAVHLDFVFIYPQTGGELLRYHLNADQKILPGETKRLTQAIYEKIGKYRKLFSPAKPNGRLVLRTRTASIQVLIKRIEYTDGSVWQSI